MQLYTGVAQLIDDAKMSVSHYSHGFRRIDAALYRSYRCNRLIIDTIYSSASRGLELDFLCIFFFS